MSDDCKLVPIRMYEWQTIGPEQSPELTWENLKSVLSEQAACEKSLFSRRLELRELRHGLQIKTASHVGRVRIGGLDITILPKISGNYLLPLLQYAYGFRHLDLTNATSQGISQGGIEELLVYQLNAEARDLIAAGLMRSYVPQVAQLDSPRGRIDLSRLARRSRLFTTTLPCVHHPRIEDTLPNRVLMAGLNLAATLVSDIGLRRDSRRLAEQLADQVSAIRLNDDVLDRTAATMNRLYSAYLPALTIIRLLHEAHGIALQNYVDQIEISGFLFDMNAFFQAVVSRFLRENLPGYHVQDEVSLKGMFRYDPQFNPRQMTLRPSRPDFLVSNRAEVISILDAKYRDLWQNKLPRAMLYQLVVYAISNRANPRSCILYPAASPLAEEARIKVTDPRDQRLLGHVSLRPIHLPTLVDMIQDETPQGGRLRETFAKRLAIS